MSAYSDFQRHVLCCDICSRSGAFCPTGLALGCAFEEENRRLDSIADAWEPPLVDPISSYPTEGEMDRAYRDYQALPDDVKRL